MTMPAAFPLDAEPDFVAGDLVAAALCRRRSVRWYTDAPVPAALLSELLQAATCAPSPHNRQPWRFAVLASPESRSRLALAMAERLRADRARDGDPGEAIDADAERSRRRIESAPAAVLVALSMADMDRYRDRERQDAEFLMAVQAAAAAIQNMLVLAEARGLGAAWMCAPLFCPDTVRETLRLPEDWHPQALLTLGCAARPPRPKPLKPVQDLAVWL